MLRSVFAAFALFALSVPALAQAPAQTPLGQPSIERVRLAPVEPGRVNSAGQFAQGTRLELSVEGTPGGRAQLQIAGMGDFVPLKETRPGVYTGTVVVPRDNTFNQNSLVRVTLQVGERTANLNDRLGGPISAAENPQANIDQQSAPSPQPQPEREAPPAERP